METLILKHLIKFKLSNSHISPSISPFQFPLRETIKFRHFSCGKSLSVSPTKPSLSTEPSSYGGWDNIKSGYWSSNSDESIRFRDFLFSIGINDRKHVFMFLLGLVCALAISRVNVSTIILFSASILVFGIGFSFGYVKGGSFNELSSNYKRRSKEEIPRVYSEKLKNLLDIFDGFDVKVNDLKNNIQRAIVTNRINAADLENYVNLVELLRISVLNARNVVEFSVGGRRN